MLQRLRVWGPTPDWLNQRLEGCPSRDSGAHSHLRTAGVDQWCRHDPTCSFKRLSLAAMGDSKGGVSISGKRGFREKRCVLWGWKEGVRFGPHLGVESTEMDGMSVRQKRSKENLGFWLRVHMGTGIGVGSSARMPVGRATVRSMSRCFKKHFKIIPCVHPVFGCSGKQSSTRPEDGHAGRGLGRKEAV